MAGAGYKLFNTGDVLTAAQVNTYLMEQTVMVFANAAARTTALSGVVSEGMISYLKDTNAVEVYDGSNWVSSDDPNAIQNTIVDAKGDLITATAADTPSRIAVGNNGETLVADNSATTGLRWQGNFAAGKNKVINGDFGIWQRGTSFTTTANIYTADRWFTTRDGNGTVTTSQQTFTAGSAPVAGYEGQYFLQMATSSLGTSTYHQLIQRIEDVRTFAGQTVTISFWAKLSSGTVGSSYVRINQYFGSGGSASVTGSTNTYTPTGSWQRFSATVTLASISGKTIGTGSYIEIDFVTPFTATNTMQFWGVQLEAGNTATAFQTATGTLAGELAACQRYYYRAGSATLGGAGIPAICATQSTTSAYCFMPLPVAMRVAPTSLEYANVRLVNFGTAAYSISSLSIDAGITNPNVIAFTADGATGMTQNRLVFIYGTTVTPVYIAANAEL